MLQVGLTPDSGQEHKLKVLHTEFNSQCNRLTKVATLAKVYGRKSMHRMMYAKIKGTSRLGSQMVCNVISQVYSEFVLHPKRGVIRLTRPIIFDKNTCTLHSSSIGLYTLDGRIRVPCAPDASGAVKEASLSYSSKGWLLRIL